MSLELVGLFSWRKKTEAVIAGLVLLLKWQKQRRLVQSEVLRRVKVPLDVGFLQSRAHTSTVRCINLKTPLMQRGATCWDNTVTLA